MRVYRRRRRARISPGLVTSSRCRCCLSSKAVVGGSLGILVVGRCEGARNEVTLEMRNAQVNHRKYKITVTHSKIRGAWYWLM